MLKWTLTNNITSEVYVLKHDPLGWESLQLTHNRSEDYDGLFFDFSLSVAFGCRGSGKEFVDSAYKARGSQADVSLLLEYSCGNKPHQKIRGKLNFSSYKEKYKSKKLYSFIDIEQDGITQQIKNRESTDVDLFSPASLAGVPLIPYSDLTLNLHSRSIFMRSDWTASAHGCCTNRQSDDFFQVFMVPNLTLGKADFEKSLNTVSTCGLGADWTQPDEKRLPNYFAGAPAVIQVPDGGSVFTQTNTVTISYSFDGTLQYRQQVYDAPDNECDAPQCLDSRAQDPLGVGVNAITSASLRLYFGDDTAANPENADCPQINAGGLQYIDLVTIPSHIWNNLTNTEVHNFSELNKTAQIPLREGDRVWIYWVLGMAHPAGLNYKINVTYNLATVVIESNTVAEATTCKALPIHEALSRICEGITDKQLAFKSSFFGRTNSQGISYPVDGAGSRTAITDGYRIRGFQQVLSGADVTKGQTKKGIVTNLKDAYNSLNSVWGVGLGVGMYNGVEVIEIEEKTYFWKNKRIARFSNVPNLEMEFLADKAYSAVEIGYKKFKPDFKNGLDEPNGKCTWEFTKIKSYENKLSLLSDYVTGSYALETTRRKNVIFQTSDDTNYDDSIFLIALSLEDGEYEGSEYEPSEYFTNGLSTPERNENITVLSGLIDPATAYNLRFNLMSNFDRVMNQFTNDLTKNQPQPIKYTYFEGNASMRFQYNSTAAIAGELNGEAVENIQDTTLPASRHRRGNPIIVPEQYSFTYPVSYTEYLDIIADLTGYIEFSESDKNYKQGYIKTFTYHMIKGMGEFTLIRKY